MIKGYFGVPGCGKSTTLVKEYRKNRRKYKNIYSVNIEIKGVKQITKEDFEKYKFPNSLILWDEITLDYDNRAFKSFSNQAKEAWLLHRHFGTDIIYCTQNYENVDKKIRDLTLELWYMQKSVVWFLKGFTTCKRIYRNININENTADLTLGYRFCNLIESFFVSNFKIIWRRLYYKYFDSWDELSMKERIDYEESNIHKNYDWYNIDSDINGIKSTTDKS